MGPMVLSTIHAQDAPHVILRLLEIGVEPYFINATLTAVIAQRLVRRLCIPCRGSGSPACSQRGYAGRIGVYELMEVTDPLREAVKQRAPVDAMRAEAIQ